jgi:hypothetical protein
MTLDALSTYPSGSDAPIPGRLTTDVDPPGFESSAAWIPTAGVAKPQTKSRKVVPFRPARVEEPKQRRADQGTERTKAALRDAERILREARKKAQEVTAAREKAAAEANAAEEKRVDAEERCRQARLAEEEARNRLDSTTTESEKAARDLEEAERAVREALVDSNESGNKASE